MSKKEIIEVEELPIDNIKYGMTYLIQQANPNYFTHDYYKYPCKFIPEIPKWAINSFANENTTIFDPFFGSGTTLLEGIIQGHDTYGTEIDSVSKLICKAKTTPLNNKQIKNIEEFVKTFNDENNLKNIEPFIAKINNLHHWFPDENINKLGRIKKLIDKEDDEDIKIFLKVCFAAIIKKCSNADEQSPKPYVSSRIEKIPGDPYIEFPDTVEKYLEGMKELVDFGIENTATILNGDALNIDANINVDLVVTSPPYINAFDYGRVLRLENLWLDLLSERSLRKQKREYFGTEYIDRDSEIEKLTILNECKVLKNVYEGIRTQDEKRALVVKKFFEDMKKHLLKIKKVLSLGGYYCIVIGNNNIRNIEVESWKILRNIAEQHGYSEKVMFSYLIRNPYIRIPRSNRGGKIKVDHVLVLERTS
jgi:DNA modification methylase